MTERRSGGNPGVGCSVVSCKYNTTERRCCAESISIRSEKSETKGETYCSTFCPRGCC